MGKVRIEELYSYLMELAPIFFSSQMKGASQEDISGLEEVANRTFNESYRTFLHFFGRTSAQALNPFLNDRDFEIETIKDAYQIAHEDCMEFGYCMPESIIFFSSSDILGEVIYLRQPVELDGNPDIGYLDWDTGELHLNSFEKFEDWLFFLAFRFKLAQLDYMKDFSILGSNKTQALAGCSERYMETMNNLGFKLVFELLDGTVCHESTDVSILCHTDDISGSIASNDEGKVEKISGLLAYHLNMTISNSPGRVRAPKQ